MNSDDPYSVWKRRRSQVDVDSHFADRVMKRIAECEPPQGPSTVVVAESRPSRFAWRAQVAAAVFVAGLGFGLFRACFFIVLLLLGTSKGY
jgi:hypothetical protein